MRHTPPNGTPTPALHRHDPTPAILGRALGSTRRACDKPGCQPAGDLELHLPSQP